VGEDADITKHYSDRAFEAQHKFKRFDCGVFEVGGI